MGRRSKPPALAYVDAVLRKKRPIPACKFIKLACERFRRDLKEAEKRGFYFDQDAAEYVVDFFRFLHHSKGEWAGDIFELEPWQEFILWNLFGWLRVADGFRRFRVAYIELPRKQGKSTQAAGIGLFLFFADGEPGAEVYTGATKRDQARIVHSEAIRMVRASPLLRQRIGIYKDNLSLEDTASKYEPLGADADSLDGLNPHGAIIDELHAHKKRLMYDVLESAMGARRQPLLFVITTAGYDQTSICWEQHDYTRQVLEGAIEDDTHFGFIACADEGDDWKKVRTWKKANPNYGVSLKPDYLKARARKAAQSPASLNAFLRLHLDIWTQQATRWISLEKWDACRSEYVEKELLGRACWGGLDLAAVSDLTALALIFPDPDAGKELRILCRSWCPKARLTADDNRYRDQYQLWARQGWLQVTPGDATDYDFIKAQVIEDAQRFQLADFNVDRLFQGHQLMQDLEKEGLKPIAMGQGFLSMAVPMKEFERRMLARTLRHDGNPVLRWAVDNVVALQDPAANLKPSKKDSQGKIDPFVAVVMALDRAVRYEQSGKSIYEERGIRVL